MIWQLEPYLPELCFLLAQFCVVPFSSVLLHLLCHDNHTGIQGHIVLHVHVHKLNVGWKQIRFLFKVRTNLIRNVANFASRCRKSFSVYSFFFLFALLHDLNYYPIFLLSKQKPVKLIYWTWSFTNRGKQSTVACLLLFCVYSLSR